MVMATGSAVFSLIVYFSLAFVFWNLLWSAEAYNEAMSGPLDTKQIEEYPYDKCGSLALEDSGTRWTFIYKLNAYLLTSLCAFLLCSLTGLCKWQSYRAANPFLGCGNAILIYAMIMAGAGRLNTPGELCASNDTVYDVESGASWSSDATTLKSLFIAEAVLVIPIMCYVCVGMWAGMIGGRARDKIEDSVYYRA